MPEAESAKTQTTSPLAARCQRFYLGGLRCGRYTTSNRGSGAANRGELRHARVRHAGDTPQEGFVWRKTPTATGVESAGGTESPAAVRMSGKSPAPGPKGGPTSGTKLSWLTRPCRMCGTKLSQHESHGPTSGTKLSTHTRPRRMRGTKLSLLARNGPIWRCFCMQGEFYTVLATKKPSRESFVPNARQSRGKPRQHTRPHRRGGRRQGLVQINFACNSKTQVTQRREPVRNSAMPKGNCMRN